MQLSDRECQIRAKVRARAVLSDDDIESLMTIIENYRRKLSAVEIFHRGTCHPGSCFEHNLIVNAVLE